MLADDMFADDMAAPWLTIIGLGENGLEGLSGASRNALDRAEIIFGAARHIALLDVFAGDLRVWPVPYADGIPLVMAERGRNVVVLASGDPFWFGAGTVLTKALAPDEWCAFAGVSSFALAANHLGWALERTVCLGLHAAPLSRVRPYLHQGQRLIVLLRDGHAAADLADYLCALGFGQSKMHILEALGGPRARHRVCHAERFLQDEVHHPVCVALQAQGQGLSLACGLQNDHFAHDGQISKAPIRAMTLAALAPRAGELLWDLGGGSGSISIEWLRRHPMMRAICVERDKARAARIVENARAHGVDWLECRCEAAQALIAELPPPDAVFIGGGLDAPLLDAVWTALPKGARLVINAVTLEAEMLLNHAHAQKGGALLRVALSQADALGGKRGWKAGYPIVQWSIRK